MDLVYRKIRPDEKETVNQLFNYSFPPVVDYLDGVELENLVPPQVADERYGLFDEGDNLYAAITHHRFRLHVRGRWLDAAGTSVAVGPPVRSRGMTETMLEYERDTLRGEGIVLNTGWPFERSFYEQYGSATLSRFARARGPISALPGTPIEGRVTYAMGREDYALLDEVYQAFAPRYNLTLDRAEEWWKSAIFPDLEELDVEGSELERHFAVIVDDGPVAYLTYRIIDERFVVDEFAYRTHSDWMQLLGFVRRHATQAKEFQMTMPTDVPILDVVSDPEQVEYTVELGPIGRVTDVRTAVESIPYGELDATLTVRFDDPDTEWNDGTFTIDVTDGEATVEESQSEWDARMSIGTFTQLFVGYHTAEQAADVGTLEAGDDQTIETLGRMYPDTQVWCSDIF